MTVTRLGQPIPLLNSGLGTSSSVPGSGIAGQVVTSNGSNGSYWGENVARITANGSNVLASPFVSVLSGTGVSFSVSSNALTISSTASGGSSLTVEEVDGSPSVAASKLVFPNGTLGVVGTVATYTPAAGSGTFYEQPTVTNYGATFSGSGTSTAVTISAPTTGDKLIAIVYAVGRGANSITETNVTWTQRYTGNGNSSFLEVWTGVCSGTGGTTATAAFTGSNVSYVEVFTVNSAASAFTAAAASATATSAGATLASVESGALTLGNHIIVATTATGAVSTSYSGVSHMYVPLTTFGGVARSGIFRTNTGKVSYWSLSNTSSAFFTAVISLT